MADEEETREVLFPDWKGPDETGLTIEQTSEGEIFVKEVKGESPAARSGRVYEGDQIVGATVYFDNMTPQETAELLKTLNRHKVGLKLQNKGDKSPGYSPLSTPCRSPMGTLTWEGKARFGGSSPDIILGGDDEDYKRIYTKKIKPRLKSEDLAEGVDVRTERHSSTSSDGSTITTVTRRITTYTVEVPGGISEQLELSSPELRGLRYESGEGSPCIRIPHGNLSGKVEPEKDVFDSSHFSYTGPQVISPEAQKGSGGVRTTTITRESETSMDPRFKVPQIGGLDKSGERRGRSIQVSGTSITLGDSTHGGIRQMSRDVEGVEKANVEIPDVRFGILSRDIDAEPKDVRTGGFTVTKGNVALEYHTAPDGILGDDVNVTSMLPMSKADSDITLTRESKNKPQVQVTPQEVDIQGAKGGFAMPKIKVGTYSLKGSNVEGLDVDLDMKAPKSKDNVDVSAGFKAPDIDSIRSGVDIEGPETVAAMKRHNIKISSIKETKPKVDIKLKNTTIGGDIEVSPPNTTGEVIALNVDSKFPEKEKKDPNGKLVMPKIKMESVKVEGPDVNVSDIEIKGACRGIKDKEVDFRLPGIGIGAPDVNIAVPELDSESSATNMKGPKINIPTIKGMKKKEIDVNLNGSHIEGDVSASIPKMTGDIRAPESEAIADIDAKGELKMPKLRLPKFGLTSSSVESAVDVSHPKADISKRTPKVEIKGPGIDVYSLSEKNKDASFKVSTVSGPKLTMPDVDINLRGPTVKGDRELHVSGPQKKGGLDVSVPKAQGQIKGPKVEIKSPKVDVVEKKGGIDFPKFKMPSFNLRGPKVEAPEVNINLPKADVDVNAPDAGIKAPEVEFEAPDVDLSLPKADINVNAPEFHMKGPVFDSDSPTGKMKTPKFKMPKLSGPKLSMPDVDFQLGGPKLKGDVNVSVPKLEGDFAGPDIDVKGSDVNIEGRKGGFVMPKIKMPKFNIKGPNVEVPDVDINLPRGNVDLNAPDVAIKSPEMEMEGADASIKGPKIKMPRFKGSKMPNIDVDLTGPNLEGDLNVSLPKTTGEMDIPDVEIEGPDADLKGGFSIPKFRMPSFGMKGPQIECPDLNVSAPKAEIDVNAPKIDIEGPGLDIESPSGKIRGPSFKLPTISGPKLTMPDVNLNLRGPKIKGDMDISAPKVEGEIVGPDVGIEGPDMNIERAKGGIEFPKIKMPKIKVPKIPDTDVNLRGPKLEGDVSLPKMKVEIETPEMDIERPDADIEGGFRLPKFRMPSFGMKGPQIECPDLNVSVPKADIDVNAPKIDIEGPEIDMGSPSAKIKGPSFKLPEISGPHISMPTIKMPSLDFRGRKGDVPDVDMNLPKGSIDVNLPDVGIQAPEFEIERPDASVKGPKLKMPKLKGVKIPDIDLDLKRPNLEGDLNVSLPGAKVEMDTPDVEIEGTDADLKAGFKMPKFKIPSFGMKGPQIGGPDLNVTVPKADIDASVPKVDIDVPEIEMGSPSGKIKGPSFKLPDISGPHISMPTIKMPSLDFRGRKGDVPDVDMNLPKGSIDMNLPDVGIQAPEIEIERPDASGKGPKLKMPKLKGVKIPDIDLDLKRPNLEGDLNVSLPGAKVEMDTPDVEIEGTDADLKAGFKMPKFKIPSFGIKGPQIGGPDLNVTVPKADIDASFPKVDIDVPEIEMGSPSGKIKGPSFKLPEISGPHISMPTIKMPSLDFRGRKGDVPDVDMNLPEGSIDMNLPDVGIQAPEIEIERPDASVKGPKLKMPKLKGVKIPDIDLDLKRPNLEGDLNVSLPGAKVEMDTPDVEIEGTDADLKAGFKMPKFKIPSFGMKGPQIGGPDLNVSVPKADIDASVPKVDIDVPEIEMGSSSGKIKGPSFQMPTISGPKLSMPDVDLHLKRPKTKGGLDVSVPKAEGQIKGPKVEIKGPKVEVEGTKRGFDFPKFKMPSFHLRGPKVEAPEVNINLPKANVDVTAPDAGIKAPEFEFEASDVDLSLPKADINVNAPEFHMKGPVFDSDSPTGKMKTPKFKMPKLSGPKLSMPDVDFQLGGPKLKGDLNVSVPKLEGDFAGPDIDVKGSDVNIEGRKGGFVMPKIKMPKFNIKGPNVEVPDVDLNLPKGNVDLNAPDVSIKSPDMEMEGADASIKGPKIKMPRFKGSKMPNIDVDLTGPNLEGDLNVSLPKTTGEMDIPDVEIEGPDADLKGGFSIPKFRMPSFGMKGPQIECPDLNVSAPKAEIDVNAPKIDIEGPGLDIESPSGKIKGPSFKLPTISGPKLTMPDMDINLRGPKIKGDMDFSAPKVEGEIVGPDVGIEGPDMNIAGAKGGIEFPKIKMPKVKLPKIPDADVNLKGPKLEGDVSLPKMKVGIETPEIDIERPDADIEGGFRLPKFRMPSFGMKGPQIECPDLNVSAPEADIDVNAPKIAIEGPEIDMGSPSGKIKGPSFKLPEISGPHISMPTIKMPSLDFRGRKGDVPDVDMNLPKGSIDVNLPDVGIQAPEFEIERPDASGKGPKLKMPKLKGVKIPDIDLDLKRPNLEGDLNVSLPGAKVEMDTPDVEIEGPDADLKAGFKMPKFKIPSFGMKGPQIGGPDLNMSVPKVDIDASVPKVDIDVPEIEMGSPSGKIKGPGFQMPTISGPKLAMPDVDLHLKRPKTKGGLDVSVPKAEGQIKGPKVEIKGPKVDVEGTKGGFDFPNFKMPSFHLRGPKVEAPEVNINLPKANVDVNAPDAGIKAPEVEIEAPDVDLSLPKADINVNAPEFHMKGPVFDSDSPTGKMKTPKFKMPKLSGPKLSMPDVDFQLGGPKLKGDLNVSVPKLEGDFAGPDIDVKGSDVNIEGRKGGFVMPKIKMPKFNIKGPNVEVPDVDINLPKGNVDLNAPDVAIKSPEMEMEGADASIKGPKIKMPRFKGSKMPNIDVDLTGHNLEGDLNVSLPKTTGEMDIPDVEIEGPDAGLKGGFNIPKFRMPSFGMKGPQIECPDLNVSAPKAEIDVNAPKIDIEGPGLDIESPSGKIKGPSFKLPTISGPKLTMPDVNLNLRGPKMKGDMDFSAPKVEGEIVGPDVGIEGPDMNIAGAKGGIEFPKIKMPKIKLPKIPDTDVDLRGPKLEGDVSLPKMKVEIETPEMDIERPDADIEGGFRLPKFRMPSFGMKGPQIECPDFNMSAPEADIDVSAPKIAIEGPEIDMGSPSGKIKGPSFKLPEISGPHISMPTIKMPSLDFRGRKGDVPDVDMNLPEGSIDMNLPDVGIQAPEIEIERPDASVKGPKLKMPKLKGVKIPDIDLDLKRPNLEGDLNVSLPGAKVEMDTPDVEIEGTDADLKTGFKMPKFKIPSFGMKGPQIGGPDLNVSVPKADIDASVPKVDIDVPEIEMGSSSGKIKGPSFQMPTISGPKLSMPDVDLHLKRPKTKGGLDVSVPKAEGQIKGPKVEIKGPKVDVEETKGGFDFPKFKMPSFHLRGPKVEAPEVNINLPKANVDVTAPDAGIKAPEFEIEAPDVDLSLPKADINVNAPEFHMKGPVFDSDSPTGKMKTPKFKMPKLSGPKLSMPDVDFQLGGPKLKGDLNVSVPKLEGDFAGPDIDVKGSDVNIEGRKGGFVMPKIKMPKFNIRGPNVEVPDVDINLPKANVDLNAPDVAIKSPEMEMEGADASIKGPKIKLPRFKGSKMPNIDVDLTGPNLEGDLNVSLPKTTGEMDIPDVEIEGPDADLKGGFSIPKFRMPSFGMKGPQIECPDLNVSAPKAEIDVNAPKIDIEGPGLDIESPSGKIKGPSFKLPTISGPKLTMPDVNLNLRGPKIKGDMDFSAPKVEGEIVGPDVGIEGPNMNIAGAKGGIEFPKIKMPKVKLPKIPDADVNLKGPKLEGDVSLPKMKVEIETPEMDIERPDVDIEGGFRLPKFRMPSFGMKGPQIECPDLNVSAPEADIDVNAPKIAIEGPEIDMGSPSAKIKGPSFKLPEISGPHISMPTIKMPSLDFRGRKGDVPDVDMNLPKGSIDMNLPDVGIQAPEIEIERPDASGKGPKLKMPKLKGVKIPGFDLDLKRPNLEGDLNVSLPEAKVEMDTPDVEIEGPDADLKAGFKMPKFQIPSFGMKGPQIGSPDLNVSVPKADIDASVPKVDIDVPEIEMGSSSGRIKGPSFQMPTIAGPKLSRPDVNLNLRGPEIKGDMDFSAPKVEGEIVAPDVGIEGPDMNIEGVKGGFEFPKIKMPKIKVPKIPDTNVNLRGPKLEGDVSLPKTKVEIETPEMDIERPDADIEGGFKLPNIKTAAISGPNMPDLHVSGPKIKGDIDLYSPKLEGDIKVPDLNIRGAGFEKRYPTPDLGRDVTVHSDTVKTGVKFPKFKAPKFGIKSENDESEFSVTPPTFDNMIVNPEICQPNIDANVNVPDTDAKGRGIKGKFKLPKVKGKVKTSNIDIETPAVNTDIDATNIRVKGTKVKKPLFGRLHFPGVELDLKSTKAKVDGSGGLEQIDVELPSASLNTSTGSPAVGVEGKGVKIKSPKVPNVTMPAPDVHVNLKSEEENFSAGLKASGGLHYPEGSVTFPKIQVPKFGIALPQLEEQPGGANAELPDSADINIQPPSVSCKVSSENLEFPSPQQRYSESKINVKIPKLFGKSKAKGGSAGDLRGTNVELRVGEKGGQVSKDFSMHTGKTHSGKLELESDPKVGVSHKGKSASLDLLTKSRHRSSSLSDEGGLSVSSVPSSHQEAESGDISLDLGGGKVKGKKGKLKFGTFGGFGSKSKGSYEVTLGEECEAGLEGNAGVSLTSKKSRLSSSSSSDSGGGFRFPRLEFSVSPKK
ncbi:neuroblast differentiation-associated protein AHNAK isoform X6 [Nelusetta ayraudi]|uniref:neuroblast differentiation-associated protein AHNAK isoform X6 n=1 Tax=Nelusetta ayraudi TaxID=303726 RepID=UPI003F71AEFE